ncbi:MAG TPA: LuxR C-terminal-related transcriptional regulator, partial [Thermoleophilaceae bacterium]|nr:LuxR C-terminal-related transcriptional regulator [Thermoleophilaceae bacterium]
ESLSHADKATSLGAEDLELLATSAYMLGRDDDYLSGIERAHHAYLDAGGTLGAVRCAFWLGINLAAQGETGRATGWFGRAQRLIDREERDCVERGYLLLPIVLRHVASGDWEAAYATAAEAGEIGERFADPDLFALAAHEQGHCLVKLGRPEEGLGLLDETMVAVVGGELSPIVTGLVYCGVIAYCQELYELRRAQEWTAALTQWCEQQPDMVPYTGQCLVHRAEIMQLHGAWPDALEEARRAGRRFAQRMKMNQLAAAQACYLQAEVHRLQGELAAAEEEYREASRCGWEPQPGLALMRLAQGNGDAAAAAIRRVVGETAERLERARLLPAYAEIMLAVGDTREARRACRELEEIAVGYESGLLGAMGAHTRGAVDLAEGDARAALVALRRAWQLWLGLEAPYEGARVRVAIGLACRALGDDDTAALELEAARGVFAELGAAPDLARVELLTLGAASGDAHGLTARELEVLRMVAAGETNKAIAAELVLSERTVERHLSNIFTKLRVSSRAAATAYAYQHQLV